MGEIPAFRHADLPNNGPTAGGRLLDERDQNGSHYRTSTAETISPWPKSRTR
jgi:hypothetical protein